MFIHPHGGKRNLDEMEKNLSMSYMPQEESRNETCARVQALLLTAIREAREAILCAPDDYTAFHAASHAADTLRTAADAYADLRAEIVKNIAEKEKLSLAKLAERVGVSKARAGQLVETGRRVQHLRTQSRSVEGTEDGEHERPNRDLADSG